MLKLARHNAVAYDYTDPQLDLVIADIGPYDGSSVVIIVLFWFVACHFLYGTGSVYLTCGAIYEYAHLSHIWVYCIRERSVIGRGAGFSVNRQSMHIWVYSMC